MSDTLKNKQVSAIVCILDNDKLLLYRRKNTTYQPDMLGLIGGKFEPGETPVDTIIREVVEETSLIINPDDLELIHTITEMQSGKETETFVFCTRSWSGTPENLEPHKCGGLFWHPIDELPPDTIPVIYDIVKLIPSA